MKARTAVASASPTYCRCGHSKPMHERNGTGSCFSKHCPECEQFRPKGSDR